MAVAPPPLPGHSQLTRTAIDEAAVAFFADQPFTHAITLTYNESLSGAYGAVRRLDYASGGQAQQESPAWPSRPPITSAGVGAHRNVTFGRMRGDFGRFDAELHRRVFNRKWHRLPGRRRLHSVVFSTGLGHNAHLHGMFRVHEERTEQFERLFGGRPDGIDLWRQLVPAGTSRAAQLHDPEGWARYCISQSSFASPEATVIWGSEFWTYP